MERDPAGLRSTLHASRSDEADANRVGGDDVLKLLKEGWAEPKWSPDSPNRVVEHEGHRACLGPPVHAAKEVEFWKPIGRCVLPIGIVRGIHAGESEAITDPRGLAVVAVAAPIRINVNLRLPEPHRRCLRRDIDKFRIEARRKTQPSLADR